MDLSPHRRRTLVVGKRDLQPLRSADLARVALGLLIGDGHQGFEDLVDSLPPLLTDVGDGVMRARRIVGHLVRGTRLMPFSTASWSRLRTSTWWY